MKVSEIMGKDYEERKARLLSEILAEGGAEKEPVRRMEDSIMENNNENKREKIKVRSGGMGIAAAACAVLLAGGAAVFALNYRGNDPKTSPAQEQVQSDDSADEDIAQTGTAADAPAYDSFQSLWDASDMVGEITVYEKVYAVVNGTQITAVPCEEYDNYMNDGGAGALPGYTEGVSEVYTVYYCELTMPAIKDLPDEKVVRQFTFFQYGAPGIEYESGQNRLEKGDSALVFLRLEPGLGFVQTDMENSIFPYDTEHGDGGYSAYRSLNDGYLGTEGLDEFVLDNLIGRDEDAVTKWAELHASYWTRRERYDADIPEGCLAGWSGSDGGYEFFFSRGDIENLSRFYGQNIEDVQQELEEILGEDRYDLLYEPTPEYTEEGTILKIETWENGEGYTVYCSSGEIGNESQTDKTADQPDVSVEHEDNDLFAQLEEEGYERLEIDGDRVNVTSGMIDGNGLSMGVTGIYYNRETKSVAVLISFCTEERTELPFEPDSVSLIYGDLTPFMEAADADELQIYDPRSTMNNTYMTSAVISHYAGNKEIEGEELTFGISVVEISSNGEEYPFGTFEAQITVKI